MKIVIPIGRVEALRSTTARFRQDPAPRDIHVCNGDTIEISYTFEIEGVEGVDYTFTPGAVTPGAVKPKYRPDRRLLLCS